MVRPIPAAARTQPLFWLAVGLGSGLSPKAPGTVGTVAAIPLYLLLAQLPLAGYLAVVAVAAVAGIVICRVGAELFGTDDPSAVVWDEWVGFWITMAAAPPEPLWIGVGLVLFRLFDIVKRGPVGWCDRHIHGGLGIMLDDVVAGLLAFALLQGLLRWFGV